ncbi:MAG: HAF repeat/PEP-CTERM domain-containing protein, partial [Myxococcota bacterium]
MQTRFVTTLVFIIALATPALGEPASFQRLGDLPGGAFLSRAHAVSSDGVVVGTSRSERNVEAFRWEAASGMVGLGDLEGGTFLSEAFAVSADGTVVVGRGSTSVGSEAFRWQGAFAGLGDLAGGSFSSRGFAVSSDGLVVAGTGRAGTGFEAFVWQEGVGMVGLGDLPGGT